MRAQPVDRLAPEVTAEGLRHRVMEIYLANLNETPCLALPVNVSIRRIKVLV